MRITSHIVENFLGLRSAKISLEDKGLVLIQGVNHDDTSQNSNGSGKSSLADSVFWVLFGETARGLTGDAVINSSTGKECKVETILEGDSEKFRVTRWRKCKGMHKRSGLMIESWTGSEWKDLTKGKDTLTQEEVERALGCSKDVFKGAVYSGQEAMADLPSMTDRQLKSLIEEAAGITRIEEAYHNARRRLVDAEATYRETETEHSQAEYDVNRITSERESLLDKQQAWEDTKDERVRKAEEAVKDAFVSAQKIAADRDDLKNKLTVSEDNRLQEESEQIEVALDELNKELSGLSAQYDEEKRLAGRLSDARSDLRLVNNQVKNVMEDRERKAKELSGVRDKIGTPCGECGKLHTEEDLETTTAALQRQLDQLTSKLEGYKRNLASETRAFKSAEKKLEEFRATMRDTSDISNEQQLLRTRKDNVSRKRTERDREHARLSQLGDQLEQQKERVRSLKETAISVKSEENPFDNLVDEITGKLCKAEEWLKELNVKLLEASEYVEDLKQVSIAFGPKGVRAHILDTVTPFLNDRTSGYLSALSDGNLEAEWTTLATNSKGEFIEKFSIDVSKKGMGQSFAAISGGEKRKVRLACALALQDLVASRASKPIDLWIGDEIDDAMDTSGLERLMNVLENKAREKGTVLVISHNDLADWIRDTVTVEMKDKTATVTGVLNL